MEAFQNFLNPTFQNFDLLDSLKRSFASLTTAGPMDVIDILIVAYIIYRVMKLLKDTSAARLAKGVLVLLLVMLLTSIASLTTISFILQMAVTYAPFVLVVIFQPELRACLSSLAKAT